MFSGRGKGANLAPSTMSNLDNFYSYWLGFLSSRNWLDTEAQPAQRVTREALSAYVEYLNDLSSVSVAAYVRGLASMLSLLEPYESNELVRLAASNLEARAEPSRDNRSRLASANDLYDGGINRMTRFLGTATENPIDGERFLFGMLMALLSAKPLRRRNVIGARTSGNLSRLAGGRFLLSFAAADTKESTPIKAPLPKELSPFLELWLTRVRPGMVGRKEHDALFVSRSGDPLTGSQLYSKFCSATYEELGRRINPHLARHCVATSLAIAAPELISIVRVLLDHSSEETGREHYDLADNLHASDACNRLLGARVGAALRRVECRRTEFGGVSDVGEAYSQGAVSSFRRRAATPRR